MRLLADDPFLTLLVDQIHAFQLPYHVRVAFKVESLKSEDIARGWM